MAERHNLGQFVKDNTLALLQSENYWPGMKKDVVKHVQRCQICQISKVTAINAGLYMPLPVPMILGNV